MEEKKNSPKKKKKKVIKIICGILLSILVICLLTIVLDVYVPVMTSDKENHWENLTYLNKSGEEAQYKSQKVTKWDVKARFIQRGATLLLGRTKINNDEPYQAATDMIKDNRRIITEVQYADKYPNSFLDICLPEESMIEENGGKVPVFVYFHGGGFLFGSKSDGDPLASNDNSEASGIYILFERFLSRGIAVVSGDYAFSPEYRCPVQIEQVNQVMDFLIKHEKEYSLDMTNVMLGGGSAGADMTEIYGLIVADEKYASKFDFKPVINKDSLKGLVIDEAALDLRTFGNKGMDIMLGAWVGENNFETGAVTALVDIPENITDSYIPTFVTGSNQPDYGHNVFEDSARQLKAKLDEIGVRCDIYVPSMDIGEYGHGFLTMAGTQASLEGIAILDEFIEDVFN